MKKYSILILSALMLNTILFSKQNEDCNLENNKDYIINKPKMVGAYNTPKRYDLKCPLNFFIEAGFIYWQAKEKGLDLLSYTSGSDVSIIKPSFDYKPGIKVGIGINTHMDNWTLHGKYIWLHVKNTLNKNVPANDSFSTFYGDGLSDLAKVKNLWEKQIHIADLELSRLYFVGKKLTLKPGFGLKGIVLDQHLKPEYFSEDGTESYNSFVSYSWGIGPVADVEVNFLSLCGCKLFCNSALSLLYQDFKATMTRVLIEGAAITPNAILKNRFSDLTPVFEMQMGIGYGTYFTKDKYHFDINLGYDFILFWNQNVHKDMQATFNGINGSRENLMLHGLTILFRFDF